MAEKNLKNYFIAGSRTLEGNVHKGNVFLTIEEGKLAAVMSPNFSRDVSDRSDAYTLTEEAFCKLCADAANKSSWHFTALLGAIADCFGDELFTDHTSMPAHAAAKCVVGKTIPEAFALMPLLSGAIVSLKKAAALYRAERQSNLQAASQRSNSEPAYTAIKRILEPQSMKMVGLVLINKDISGGAERRYGMQHCIGLAQNSNITNVKAATRNGKTFLSGKGVSLETLPYVFN